MRPRYPKLMEKLVFSEDWGLQSPALNVFHSSLGWHWITCYV